MLEQLDTSKHYGLGQMNQMVTLYGSLMTYPEADNWGGEGSDGRISSSVLL